MPTLSDPTEAVYSSYLSAVGEYQAEGGYPDFDEVKLDEARDFAAYTERLRRDPRRDPTPHMPMMTLWWWIDGSTYIGRVSVWHDLGGGWADYGHLGYDIRPSMRRQGHATAMVSAARPRIHALGIDPAVVCVQRQNTASIRAIQANGAILVQRRDSRLYFHLSGSPEARAADLAPDAHA